MLLFFYKSMSCINEFWALVWFEVTRNLKNNAASFPTSHEQLSGAPGCCEHHLVPLPSPLYPLSLVWGLVLSTGELPLMKSLDSQSPSRKCEFNLQEQLTKGHAQKKSRVAWLSTPGSESMAVTSDWLMLGFSCVYSKVSAHFQSFWVPPYGKVGRLGWVLSVLACVSRDKTRCGKEQILKESVKKPSAEVQSVKFAMDPGEDSGMHSLFKTEFGVGIFT